MLPSSLWKLKIGLHSFHVSVIQNLNSITVPRVRMLVNRMHMKLMALDYNSIRGI